MKGIYNPYDENLLHEFAFGFMEIMKNKYE